MADEDEINLDDNGSSSSDKKGGLGGIFPSLLKWIIIGLAAVIVIVVVVVITVKITGKNSTTVTAIPASEEYVSGQREIYDWYTSLGIIQTTTADDPPATVRVDVALAYKKDDKAASTEITARLVELKAFLRRYFSSKTAAELRNPNNEDALENEIKNGINDKILSSSRIRDVVFQQKDVIQSN
ncbi:MAG: flagellar basal body-associated FliL family protein [Spirochaetales bacterium]|nr:flagellar basal body-associated FliL family protein [Spirochaetales bacterium]MDY5914758.1 flagellar basal body-associated FliL family protein [Treponema sp.]